MNDLQRKWMGYILTGGLSLAAGIVLGVTGTLPPLLDVIGTVLVTVANIFGISVSKPK